MTTLTPPAPAAATPTDGGRTVAPLSRRAVLLGAVVITLSGLGAGLLLGVGRGLLDERTIIALGALGGAALAVAAATRFWAVVVGMFVVRASLDALKISDYTQGSNAFDPSVTIGLVFVAAAAAWLVAQRRSGELHPLSQPTKWFLGLAGVGTLSALAAGSPSSVGVSMKIWAGALMLTVLEQAYRQRPERINAVLVAGAASAVVPAMVAVAQLAGPRQLAEFAAVSRIQGTFVHPNPFATYLVLLAIMALALRPHLRGWARVSATAVLAVGSVLTLFTYARGGWIAMVLGVLVVGAYQDRRLIAAVVAVVIAVLLLVPSVTTRLSDLSSNEVSADYADNSLAWRIDYWGRLLPLTADNPVTGIGLDQVLERSPERLMPHNSYVQALVETGALGLFALLGLIVSTTLAVRDVLRRAAPGLGRGVAVGAAAVGIGWAAQMATENLLTQAAIFWYLSGPVAFVLALRATLPASATAGEPAPGDAAETEPALVTADGARP